MKPQHKLKFLNTNNYPVDITFEPWLVKFQLNCEDEMIVYVYYFEECEDPPVIWLGEREFAIYGGTDNSDFEVIINGDNKGMVGYTLD